MGLNWRYLTMEVRPENLGAAIAGIRACQFRGFNLTIPHKVAVVAHLDRLSPAAEAIGAVNCVIHRDGELIGDNTDGKGFLQSVSSARAVTGVRAVILAQAVPPVPSESSSPWPGPDTSRSSTGPRSAGRSWPA